MTQPIGGLPYNFPNLVQIMPAVYQMHGAHLNRVDPVIAYLALGFFNQIQVSPVAPIAGIGEGNLGSPGGAQMMLQTLREKFLPKKGKKLLNITLLYPRTY